jgi:hypothetical protein
MGTAQSEFWLQLHRLAEAYDSEGLTPGERAEIIGRELGGLPPTVQRQMLIDLRHLSINLFDLYPLMASQVNRDEQKRWFDEQGGVA